MVILSAALAWLTLVGVLMLMLAHGFPAAALGVGIFMSGIELGTVRASHSPQSEK